KRRFCARSVRAEPMVGPAQQAPAPAAAQTGRRPLVVVLLAASAGIVLDRAVPLPAYAGLVLGVAAWATWLVLYRRGRDVVAAAALMVSVAALFAAWHHTRWDAFAEDEIGRFARRRAEPVCLRGRAISTPALLPAPSRDPMRTVAVGDRSRLKI